MLVRRFALALALVIPTICYGSLDVDIGSKVILSNGPGGGGGVNGGRFGVTGTFSGGGAITPFDTFCAEIAQTMNFGKVYTVVGISTANSTGAQLGALSAWAYTQFRNGTLPGFNYSNSGTAAEDSANALQHVVWQGLGLTPIGSLSANAQALKTQFVNAFNLAVNANEWNSNAIGSVRIMQLKDSRGAEVQDQLVMVVPEASSLIVWALLSAVASIGTWRLRRKENS